MRIAFRTCKLVAAVIALATGLVALQSGTKALADDPASRPPQLRAVGFDQHLGEQVPLDADFLDESGKPVKLGDYFHRSRSSW